MARKLITKTVMHSQPHGKCNCHFITILFFYIDAKVGLIPHLFTRSTAQNVPALKEDILSI